MEVQIVFSEVGAECTFHLCRKERRSCFCVPPVRFSKYLTDFHEMWHERYSIGTISAAFYIRNILQPYSKQKPSNSLSVWNVSRLHSDN
jgi:hypothetical protein